MKKIFVFLIIVTAINAQVEYSGRGGSGDFLPRFYLDLASYEGRDTAKSKIDIFIKLPYANIQFLKSNEGYSARYSVVVSVYDEEDNLKVEKIWNEKISTYNFKQTSSNSSFNVSYKSFELAPGKYKLVCKLEDLESKKYSTHEQKIKVRAFQDPVEISDIVLISEIIQTDDGEKLIPNISNLVTSRDTLLSFFYEIYSKIPQILNINYLILKEEKIIFSAEKEIDVQKGKNVINEDLKNVAFALGDYQLQVQLIAEDNKLKKAVGRNFYSKIFGFPSTIRDLDLAVQQLVYIASPNDIDYINEVKDFQTKLVRFEEFWKRLDPSPNTIENETLNEYYRRVEYANANFKGYFKGWRSDMGMVYITLGPPDQVTRRPYELSSKPYEIWDYYVLNRSFVFVDQTNFGDYRLENPAFGDWFRYRP